MNHKQERIVDQAAADLSATYYTAMCSCRQQFTMCVKAAGRHPDIEVRKKLTANAFEIYMAAEKQIRLAEDAFRTIAEQARNSIPPVVETKKEEQNDE